MSYRTISYRIISYRIVSYHIVEYRSRCDKLSQLQLPLSLPFPFPVQSSDATTVSVSVSVQTSLCLQLQLQPRSGASRTFASRSRPAGRPFDSTQRKAQTKKTHTPKHRATAPHGGVKALPHQFAFHSPPTLPSTRRIPTAPG